MQHIVTTLSLAGLILAAVPSSAQAPDATDTSAELSKLQNAIIAAEEQTWDTSSLAYRTNFPFAKLQLKKARMLQAKAWYLGGGSADAFVKRGLDALERLSKGQSYFAEKGTLTELAYIAQNDGTVQPYYLHLPRNYDPARPWPLIVFLHGYVPGTSMLDPWVLSEDVCQLAEDNGCILLIPYGRRNTDFQGVGEVDVLASTEDVKALYSIDPSRIYMSGVSMGGMGAWNMALRHPGMYAATTPISGQTDMHVWWQGVLFDWPRSRDDIPPFRRLLVEWDNPIDLVMNARNQPMFVQHGERDSLIPVEQSRTMVAAAKALDIPIKLHEFEGASHYIYWDLPCFRNAWTWTRDFTLSDNPERITYKTYSLEYDTAFWLQIVDFVQWGKAATVDCDVTAKGTALRIKTENVRLLRVDVRKAPLRKVEDFRITLNGKRRVARATANWDLYILCDDVERKQRPWPPNKRNGLCGPVEEVFDTAFMLVVGTVGGRAADPGNAVRAKKWAKDWDEFADGAPRVKLDSEVTDEDIANFNLVLFGTSRTNSVLRRMAARLPIKIGDHQYTVAGKTYAGNDLGLVMCYPNPLAPDRYVAIYAGELYGEKCGINHKHDLIPDFIVFRGGKFNYDDTNGHEVAGYFDMHWELNERLTWVRGEEK